MGRPVQTPATNGHTMRTRSVNVLVVAFALPLNGCRADAVPAATMNSHSTHTLDQVVRWTDSVELAESADVLNVTPMVSPDAEGRFLVADIREAQIREYRRDGSIKSHFGKKGYGPGEFQAPVSAVRLSDGRILVAEIGGKLTLHDSTGEQHGSYRAPASPLFNARVVGEGKVLIAGRSQGTEPRRKLLHLWTVDTDRVHSFFESPMSDTERGGIGSFGGNVATAVRGDTIAAAFAFTDTVFLFTRDGEPAGKVPATLRNFRHVPEDAPRARDVPAARALAQSATQIRDLWWLPDGRFLLQTADFDGKEERFGLMGMSRDGEPFFELAGTPRLLSARDASTLVFVTPGSLTPNRWSFAELAL